MGKQHIIELNGKRYDALTGKMVTESLTVHKPRPAVPLKPVAAQNMDGFAKRSSRAPETAKQYERSPQKSHTLMRTTVHKPQAHKVHAVATVVSHNTPQLNETGRTAAHTSSSVVKSPLIRRFSPLGPTDAKTDSQPARSHAANLPAADALSKAAINAASVVVNPLQHAIAHATAHQQPKLGRSRLHKRVAHKLHISPRALSGGSLALAGVLLITFFSYQNMPNLKMRLAASRAGVHGSLPAYQPPGFHLKNISYKAGQVDVSYTSNSDDRQFQVSQTASAWNTETLRDKLNSGSEADSPVEVPDNGKTLFLYNDSNVAWVDGGVLYKIEGQAGLSSDQLLRLANSL